MTFTAAGSLSAQPLPLQKNIRLGRPARPSELSIKEDGQTVRIRVGKSYAALPLEKVKLVTIDPVELRGGGKTAVIRLEGTRGERVAAIVTRPRGKEAEIAWIGRLDPRGDPGERFGDLLEVRDRDKDGKPEIVVGRFREGASVCGDQQTILFPKAVDPESLSLRPVWLNRLPPAPETKTLTAVATRQSPGPEVAPLMRILRFVSSSSRAGAADVSELSPPGELTDGSASTSWVEGRGYGGRGEFVTARRQASGWPIKAIAFTFAPQHPDRSRQTARPKKMWLVGDGNHRIEVEIPEDPAKYPGQRFWVVPEQPLGWKCLSIVLEEAFFPEGNLSAPAAIAEVEAYTELDFGEGIGRLVADLAGDTDKSADAAGLLAEIGKPAIKPLVEAWKRLSAQGRRRAVRVFAASAKNDEEARKALSQAARDKDDEVRQEALGALAGAGGAAVDELSSLVAEPEPVGDAAALSLARAAPQEAVTALLEAIGAQGGADRAALREALTRAIEKSGAGGNQALDAWLQKERPVAVLASVALALSAAEGDRAAADNLLDKLIRQAERFEDLWRLVQAARSLDSRPPIDDWLKDLARSDQRWMLRAEALRALYERRAPGAMEASKAALQDAYPRVRTVALANISGDPSAAGLIAEHARADAWPMVRAAAIETLGAGGAKVKTIVDAVGDPAKLVRAAAIRTLSKLADRDAWPVIDKRLRDLNEWPEVTEEAITYAKNLCVADAAEPLGKLVERALKPNAWLPDVEVGALALETLGYIKGPQQAKAKIRAASLPAAPAALQAAAKAASRVRQPCTPAK